MNTLLLTPRLLIEPPMTIAAANAWATPEERQRAGTFGSERRRREFLTWRAIVRRELGRAIRISYDEEGGSGSSGRGGFCLRIALSGSCGCVPFAEALCRGHRTGRPGFHPGPRVAF